MKALKLFVALILILSNNSFGQNSPLFIWGAGLDGTTYQKTAIYSDASYGLLIEAPKNASGSKLDITFNWRGGGISPLFIQGSTNYIGMGTTSPSAPLEVKSGNKWDGTIRANSNGVGEYSSFALFEANNLRWTLYNHPGVNNTLYFANSSGQDKVAITQSGSVGIGTTSPDAKLTVKGTVHAQEVKVDLLVPGPDYVFEPTYNLPTLAETEAYIKANKHLPEVPSAKEMEANGINLSEMNMLLLKKVEELTLYMIELKRENVEQQKEIEVLKKKK